MSISSVWLKCILWFVTRGLLVGSFLSLVTCSSYCVLVSISSLLYISFLPSFHHRLTRVCKWCIFRVYICLCSINRVLSQQATKSQVGHPVCIPCLQISRVILSYNPHAYIDLFVFILFSFAYIQSVYSIFVCVYCFLACVCTVICWVCACVCVCVWVYMYVCAWVYVCLWMYIVCSYVSLCVVVLN